MTVSPGYICYIDSNRRKLLVQTTILQFSRVYILLNLNNSRFEIFDQNLIELNG